MNIFLFDQDPYENVKQHCDKHTVKMVLEYAQLLSTAHHVLDGNSAPEEIYKKTHDNHPCAVWARETSENYAYLFKLFCALLDEYSYRYERVHATERLIDPLSKVPNNIINSYLTPFPQCMPDEYKVEGDAIQAYQNYFNGDKNRMAKWKHRPTPLWFIPK